MNKWDLRFLEMAQLVATWSKDPSTKVGSVIVDRDQRIVSTGYNGFARGVDDWQGHLENREEKLRRSIHAEANALLYARRDLTGCTLYVTHPPCARCASMICQSGIKRVVAAAPDPSFAERWSEDMRSMASQFSEAGVDYLEAGK